MNFFIFFGLFLSVWGKEAVGVVYLKISFNVEIINDCLLFLSLSLFLLFSLLFLDLLFLGFLFCSFGLKFSHLLLGLDLKIDILYLLGNELILVCSSFSLLDTLSFSLDQEFSNSILFV